MYFFKSMPQNDKISTRESILSEYKWAFCTFVRNTGPLIHSRSQQRTLLETRPYLCCGKVQRNNVIIVFSLLSSV